MGTVQFNNGYWCCLHTMSKKIECATHKNVDSDSACKRILSVTPFGTKCTANVTNIGAKTSTNFYFNYFQIVPHYYQYLMRKSEEERAQAKAAFLSGLLELTKAKSKDGPFFMGKELGMVTS